MQPIPATPTADVGLSLWDRLGISLSGLCAAHCVLTSLALAVMPLWSLVEGVHEWLHPAFVVLLIPTTVLALRRARRHRHARQVSLLLGGGMLLVLAALGVGAVSGPLAEAAVMFVGSLVLIAGHWRNSRACASCQPDHLVS